jgi:hypothetical protein
VTIELVIAGDVVVAQQTPLAVMAALPSEVILPPETAEVKVTEVTAVVVREGTTRLVVVTIASVPYAVPALLVA